MTWKQRAAWFVLGAVTVLGLVALWVLVKRVQRRPEFAGNGRTGCRTTSASGDRWPFA